MKTLLFSSLLFFIITNISGQEIQGKDHSYFKGGRIHVVPSSHQDIAWMDTPDKCIQYRDEHMITPALQRLKENKEFRFSIENALNLYEYLQRHPERLPEIKKYTLEGRLEWGATYNQPYEAMYDGEALIRQTYFGKKKLQKLLPGGKFVCAWSEDVPGRTMQAPQVFAKAGIKYLQFSRFQPGFYKWHSPDGSYITAWSPGQYDDFGKAVQYAPTEETRTKAFASKLAHFSKYYENRLLPPEFIYINSQDFAKPLDYDEYFKKWNNEVANGNSGLPFINYATGTEAIEAVLEKKARIDSIAGENPNLWLYIHGPTHQKALRFGRRAWRNLTAAETFSSIESILKKDMKKYPQKKLDEAWEQAIYPDHGWGGNHGNITDSIFSQGFANAASIADSILATKIKSISSMIKFKETGIPVVVFNPVSWVRTDPVEFTVNTEGIYTNQFQLVDETGNSIDFQTISSPSDKFTSQMTFIFIASNIPPVGYRSYYLVPGKTGEAKNINADMYSDNHIIDCRYYRVELGKGGVKSIFDKQLQKSLLRTEKFMGGEIFSMESIGFEAGEFADIQKPTMTAFEKMSQYNSPWLLLEHGPVRTVLETAHPWKNCTVKQRIIIYNTLKRIDFEGDIIGFNGERSREFRMAFPLNMDSPKIAYEVPLGIVRVGESELPFAPGLSKPEQVYDVPCREVHPREVQDWFGAYNEEINVALSSDVAVFDWVDPTSDAVNYPVLQPLLLATRRSCNNSPATNWYLQRGDHHFRFSLFSRYGDWRSGWKNGKQGARPLLVNVVTQANTSSFLPGQYSFASTDKNNVVISTIKKCDDDDQVIFRCYDMEGVETESKINWFTGIKSLAATNIIEENARSISIKNGETKAPVGKYSIETFKIQPGNNINKQ